MSAASNWAGSGLQPEGCPPPFASGQLRSERRRDRMNSSLTAGRTLVDAPRVFDVATYSFEDDRFSYGEQRFVTLGLLAGVPVSVVHTENEHEIRIISFRKATNREACIFFNEIRH